MGRTANGLFEKYRPLATERAGGFILAAEDALDLIDDIESLGLTLEGIDGYVFDGSRLGDSAKDSIYFLGEDKRVADIQGETSFNKARQFVRAHTRPTTKFDILFSDVSEATQ